MLYRHDGRGVIAITQPSHSWLSGQIARAWGNDKFDPPEPCEDVCVAASLHDIGWLAWESSPTLNAQTGLPHAFRELGALQHISIWSRAGSSAATLGRYVGLLVSLHGTGLYAMQDVSRYTPQERQALDELLAEQRAFQREMIASLRDDSAYTS